VEGDPYVPGTAAPTTVELRVTSAYLQLMGIPLLRGRPLSEADREGTPRVALINEAMARQFWPGEDPIGKRFKEVWLPDWTSVVGVVGNVRHQGLASEPEPEIYRPFAQHPIGQMSLVVRTAGDAATLASNLRGVVSSIDPDAAVSQVRRAQQLVSVSVAEPRFTTLLLTAFALLALTLAAIGIYGTMAQAVQRRTHEIGVRMALGARGGDVLRMVLRQAAKLAAIGAVVGISGALAGTRVLSTLLYGVGTLDPLTFVTVPILLIAVALFATYLPARRAARVDPMIALRAE
jgi:putative ABC transport system permease protein